MRRSHLSRRRFLRTISGGAALLSLGPLTSLVKPNPLALGPRTRVPNPFVTLEGKPILVCVKGTDLHQMLTEGLNLLGGLNKLITNHQDVLIKPNLNMAEPYPGISAVDGIVEMIGQVRGISEGAIFVGDQGYHDSSIVYSYLNLEPAVSAATGILLNFTSTYQVRRSIWNPAKPDFLVYTYVYNAPIIINFHNMKRHSWGYLTCALKNNVGTIQGPSAVQTRGYLHSFNPKSTAFLQEIAEIAGLINPELNVVDARSILTVNGPSVTQGVVKNINRIILCGDMVATDAYCAQLMARYDSTFSPATIQPSLQRAQELGLGTSDLSQVEIIEVTQMRGDANDDHKVSISDVVYSINYLFKGGPPPFPLQAADINCDDAVTISDVVYLINYLFKGGPPPSC